MVDRSQLVISAVILLMTMLIPDLFAAEQCGGPTGPKVVVGDDAAKNRGSGVPEIVLDGTELFDLGSFTQITLSAQAAGVYGIEQGGSELGLRLSSAGDLWKIERSIREPGEPEDRAEYLVALRDGVMCSSDGKVLIRGTSQGVLVLERAAAAIPADYWVHYLRVKKGNISTTIRFPKPK